MTALQKAESLRARKGGRPIAALTAYDYPTARLLDECGVDVLLVGDSLGMVVLGFPDTTHVTLDHMLHHVAAVARAKPQGPGRRRSADPQLRHAGPGAGDGATTRRGRRGGRETRRRHPPGGKSPRHHRGRHSR